MSFGKLEAGESSAGIRRSKIPRTYSEHLQGTLDMLHTQAGLVQLTPCNNKKMFPGLWGKGYFQKSPPPKKKVAQEQPHNVGPAVINPSLFICGCSYPKVMIPHSTQRHPPNSKLGFLDPGSTLRPAQPTERLRDAPQALASSRIRKTLSALRYVGSSKNAYVCHEGRGALPPLSEFLVSVGTPRQISHSLMS